MKTILLFVFIYMVAADMPADVAKAFKDNGIEPEIVDVAPTKLVSVSFLSNVASFFGF